MQVEEIITRLGNVCKSGSGYTAQCPAHPDSKNSLGISTGDNGHILMKCYAGCEYSDIVKAAGLEPADLTPQGDDKHLKGETVYKIQVAPGDIVEHVRIDEPGGKRFIWRRNGESGLNGLKLKDLPLFEPSLQGESKTVFVCEGEKAALAATRLGCRAYGTVSGASSCPGSDALEVLRGQDVVLWADNDAPGLAHMAKIEEALKGRAKSVVVISTGDNKDDAADYKGTPNDLGGVIRDKSGPQATSLVADNVSGAYASVCRFCSGDASGRVPTGLNVLDHALGGGMRPGALYLLGAPSGHGKTTLLQNIAMHCARLRGDVLFASPEMSGEELGGREIVRISGISMNKVAHHHNPNYRLPNLVKMEAAKNLIQEEKLPVHIIEDMDITMQTIRQIAKKIENIKLIIVDYAQEIANRSEAARYLAVGEVGRAAIEMGKRLKVPVIVASQVNVHKDDGKKEYAFRETKDLEHRAHCSMILEVKRYETPNVYGFYEVESTRVFARKNRSGGVFSVELDYIPELFSIKDKVEEGY